MTTEEMRELSTDDQDQVYRSFLLRCWREAGANSDNEPVWRFTLVQFNGAQVRRAFTSLEDLLTHLRQELG